MDQSHGEWMNRAAEYAAKKMHSPEYLQGYGLVAIAEALNRIAKAVEELSLND
jgi:hypothetical protein